MNSCFKKYLSVLLFVTLLSVPSQAFALVLFSGSGTLGAYDGTMSYNSLNSTSATLAIGLTNTSNLANGGYITALAFNNYLDLITGVSLGSAPVNFGLLGGPSFNNTVKGAPYGYFDIGSSTGSSFEGGGNPNKGIAVNNSGTFVFSLTGTGLDGLDENSFFSELSELTGNGEGYRSFIVRFRGFNNEGSDKVPGNPENPTVPEPMSLFLLGSGLMGAFIRRYK